MKPEYKVVDRPKERRGRPFLWDKVRAELKSLPDNKSVRLVPPKGTALKAYAKKVRSSLEKREGLKVSVSLDVSKNAVEVWERRAPQNQ